MPKVLPEAVYYVLPVGYEFNVEYKINKSDVEIEDLSDRWVECHPEMFGCRPVTDVEMLDRMITEGETPISEVLVRNCNDTQFSLIFINGYSDLYEALDGMYVVYQNNLPRTVNRETAMSVLQLSGVESVFKVNFKIVVLIVDDHKLIDKMLRLQELEDAIKILRKH